MRILLKYFRLPLDAIDAYFFWSTEKKSGIIKKLVFALLGCEVDKIFLENFDLIHCLALISMSSQRASQRNVLWLYLFL